MPGQKIIRELPVMLLWLPQIGIICITKQHDIIVWAYNRVTEHDMLPKSWSLKRAQYGPVAFLDREVSAPYDLPHTRWDAAFKSWTKH